MAYLCNRETENKIDMASEKQIAYIQSLTKRLQKSVSETSPTFGHIQWGLLHSKDMTAQEIVNHIIWQGACQGCLEALEKLIKQYKHYCRSIDMGYEKVSCKR